jgi:hypothetical protein
MDLAATQKQSRRRRSLAQPPSAPTTADRLVSNTTSRRGAGSLRKAVMVAITFAEAKAIVWDAGAATWPLGVYEIELLGYESTRRTSSSCAARNSRTESIRTRIWSSSLRALV